MVSLCGPEFESPQVHYKEKTGSCFGGYQSFCVLGRFYKLALSDSEAVFGGQNVSSKSNKANL